MTQHELNFHMLPAPHRTDPLSDAAAAQRAKLHGIAKVSRSNANWLTAARLEAKLIAQREGTVTADDVRAKMTEIDWLPSHKNAWGAVFKHRDFEWTGRFVKSTTVSGHGNIIREWRLA